MPAWRRPGPPHHQVVIWLLLLLVAALEIRATQAFIIHAPHRFRQRQQYPLPAAETPAAQCSIHTGRRTHRPSPSSRPPITAAVAAAASGHDEDDPTPQMLPAVERQLGPRLAAVLRLVPRASRVVADVGCDHFQLGMALALDDARGSRLVTRVIGVDKAAAPLEVARRGLGRLPGATRGVREGGVVEVGGRVLELRLGDGLRAMSKADGVDCVAIAGMGTRNMVEEVLAGPAAGEVLGGVRHLVLQAYDPRPLFMLDLRTHLTTTLRDAHLGPGGAGYAIVDESIVRADDRVFITLLAEAAAASQGDGGRIGEEEDGGGKEDDEAFRRLLLGRHLGRRAREDPETRALYGEYLTHHRQWFAKLVAARGRGSGGQQEAVGAMNPTVRALATIERELAGLELNRNGT